MLVKIFLLDGSKGIQLEGFGKKPLEFLEEVQEDFPQAELEDVKWEFCIVKCKGMSMYNSIWVTYKDMH